MKKTYLLCVAVILAVSAGCSKNKTGEIPKSSVSCLIKPDQKSIEMFPGEKKTIELETTFKKVFDNQDGALSFEYNDKTMSISCDNTVFAIDPNDKIKSFLDVTTDKYAANGEYDIIITAKDLKGHVLGTEKIKVKISTFYISKYSSNVYDIIPPGSTTVDIPFSMSPDYNKTIKAKILSKIPDGLKATMDVLELVPNLMKAEEKNYDEWNEQDSYWDNRNQNKIIINIEASKEMKSGKYNIDLLFESDDYKQTLQLTIIANDFWLSCYQNSKYISLNENKVTFDISINPREGFRGACQPYFEEISKGISASFSENPIIVDGEKHFKCNLEFLPGLQGIYFPILAVKNENGSSKWPLIIRKGNYDITVSKLPEDEYKPGNSIVWYINFGKLTEKAVKLSYKVSAIPKGWSVEENFTVGFPGFDFKPLEVGKEKQFELTNENDFAVMELMIKIPQDADMSNTTVKFEIRDGDNVRIEELSKDYLMPDHHL